MAETMPKTPDETLRAAAALLRERATKATPGPWNYCRVDSLRGDTPERAEVFAGPMDEHGYLTGCVAAWAEEDGDGQRLSHEDGDWLHAVNPRIGEPLAAALDCAAGMAEYAQAGGHRPAVAEWIARMVAVARVVLREEPAAVAA